jgi:subtilisin family serine protease
VDVQGWGSSVLAAGYGSYAKYDNDNNRTYNYFSGTSSATPTVASAAILIQSFYRQTTGQYLTPSAMKNLLISTGIPQGGTVTGQKIGPLPNVKNAILKLESGSKGKTESLPSLAVKIYPNPSTTYIAIQSNEDKKLDIEIINIQGRSVLKIRFLLMKRLIFLNCLEDSISSTLMKEREELWRSLRSYNRI